MKHSKHRTARGGDIQLEDPSTLLSDVSEAQLQDTIIEMARAMGFLVYHTHRSRFSEPGFPDLVLMSQEPMRPRLIFIECKAEGGRLTKGRISPRTRRYLPGQQDWVDAFGRCAGEFSPVEVLVLYPRNLDDIERILAAGGN